jgi:hypothetical protein
MSHTLRLCLRFRQADRDAEIALRHMVERHAPRHTPWHALRLAQDYAVNLYRCSSQWGVNTALDAALDYLEAQQVADRWPRGAALPVEQLSRRLAPRD